MFSYPILIGFTDCRLCFQELKLKDEECVRLSHVRNQLEQELEELTASLFEVGGTSVTSSLTVD